MIRMKATDSPLDLEFVRNRIVDLPAICVAAVDDLQGVGMRVEQIVGWIGLGFESVSDSAQLTGVLREIGH